MKAVLAGRPGGHNKSVEIDHAIYGDYYFSLCTRQEEEDELLYRLFVYCSKGFKHIGGYNSPEEAREAVEAWSDPEDQLKTV